MRKFIQKLGIRRYDLILNHLEIFESNLKNKPKLFFDKKNELEEKIKFVKSLSLAIVFLYIVIYFSFISFVISKIDYFGILTSFVNIVIEIFGISFLIIVLYLFNHFYNLTIQEINLIYLEIREIK